MRREDHRLKAYNVTVSYCGTFDIQYVFKVCRQYEITGASNKNKGTEVNATLAPTTQPP